MKLYLHSPKTHDDSLALKYAHQHLTHCFLSAGFATKIFVSVFISSKINYYNMLYGPSVLYQCTCGCMFCVLLFYFVNCVFLLLCMFHSVCSVSLCCSVYCVCVCVNVCCTVLLPPGVNPTAVNKYMMYHIIYRIISSDVTFSRHAKESSSVHGRGCTKCPKI